ncbi:S8 family serine peptidase, partial [Streptomyces yanii]|uniref:S8 family serine peptidase n=1 Tax=Streptomyces yanii TaxID=78510 RepID=UPI0031E877EF
ATTASPPTPSARVRGGQAISVSASVSSDTWWAGYGSKVATKQGIFGFSSRGPAENGALAPQVSAPWRRHLLDPDVAVREAVPEAGYSLPAGYGMANGTSMAAPQVAGAAALLLSAARASFADSQLGGAEDRPDRHRRPDPRRPNGRAGRRHHRHRRGLEAAQRRHRHP